MSLYHVHMWPSYPEGKYWIVPRLPLLSTRLTSIISWPGDAAALGRAPVSINPRRARLGCTQQSLRLALIYVPRRHARKWRSPICKANRRQSLPDQICLSVCLQGAGQIGTTEEKGGQDTRAQQDHAGQDF